MCGDDSKEQGGARVFVPENVRLTTSTPGVTRGCTVQKKKRICALWGAPPLSDSGVDRRGLAHPRSMWLAGRRAGSTTGSRGRAPDTTKNGGGGSRTIEGLVGWLRAGGGGILQGALYKHCDLSHFYILVRRVEEVQCREKTQIFPPGTWAVPVSGMGPPLLHGVSAGCAEGLEPCCGGRCLIPCLPAAVRYAPKKGSMFSVWRYAIPFRSLRVRPEGSRGGNGGRARWEAFMIRIIAWTVRGVACLIEVLGGWEDGVVE